MHTPAMEIKHKLFYNSAAEKAIVIGGVTGKFHFFFGAVIPEYAIAEFNFIVV